MRKYLYKAITLILIMNMMVLSVSCGKVGEMRSEIKSNDGIAEYAHKKTVNIAEKAIKFYEDNKYLLEKSETDHTRTMAMHNTVVEALVEKDADKLKSVFCETLLSQPDLDEQIEIMFEAIDGELIENGPRSASRSYYVKTDGILQQCSMVSVSRNLVTGDGKKYIELGVLSDDANTKYPEYIGVKCIYLLRKYPDDDIAIEVH